MLFLKVNFNIRTSPSTPKSGRIANSTRTIVYLFFCLIKKRNKLQKHVANGLFSTIRREKKVIQEQKPKYNLLYALFNICGFLVFLCVAGVLGTVAFILGVILAYQILDLIFSIYHFLARHWLFILAIFILIYREALEDYLFDFLLWLSDDDVIIWHANDDD